MQQIEKDRTGIVFEEAESTRAVIDEHWDSLPGPVQEAFREEDRMARVTEALKSVYSDLKTGYVTRADSLDILDVSDVVPPVDPTTDPVESLSVEDRSRQIEEAVRTSDAYRFLMETIDQHHQKPVIREETTESGDKRYFVSVKV
jgi:hypothetical protein